MAEQLFQTPIFDDLLAEKEERAALETAEMTKFWTERECHFTVTSVGEYIAALREGHINSDFDLAA